MKKNLKLLAFFIITSFAFIFTVNAESSITCTPKNAYIGDQITCSIKTDEPVEVTSKLSLVAGNTTLEKNGNIVYKATNKGTYDVILTTIEPGFTTTAEVNVTEKTTTTKTTMTTTTKAKSDNNYLSSITIDGEELEDFSKNNTKYFIDVENDVQKVTIKAKAEDDTAVVSIDGPKTLNVGDNEYTIAVTSENDSTKYYKIIVTREDEEESSSTEIKNIKIKGYRLNFDKTSKTFHLNIKPEDSQLDINVSLKDKNANYEIEDNDNLKDGSVIKIVVTAEDDTTDTYRIIISKKTSNIMPIIIGSLILIVIIIVIVLIIINKKRKNNSDNKKNNNIKEKSPVKDKVEKENIIDEKTIEMPAINEAEQDSETTFDDEDYNIPFDNDEEEETRILSYAEKKELEKANKEDAKTSMEIDKALENMLSFEYESEDDDE